MKTKRIVHNANDVTNIYLTNVIPEILHRHFRLPGKFLRNYTTRIIRRDGSEGEMDWLMLVELKNHRFYKRILINVEFQSTRVSKEKIKIISDYKDYAKTYYGLPVLTVIIITDGYESSELEFSSTPSDILKPIYIHMDWEEIIERLKNLDDKINNHKPLSEDEGLDMVFLPMFAPKTQAKWITEKITQLFKMDKSLKNPFRGHVGYGLSLMVKKYFNTEEKAKELLKMLEKTVENSKLRIVADFEDDYARRVHMQEIANIEEEISQKKWELAKKNQEITEKNQEITEKNQELTEKNQKITEINQELTEKNQKITEINQELTEINQKITEKNNIIAEKVNENKLLKAKLIENGIKF